MIAVEYRLCGECFTREARVTPAQLWQLIRDPRVKFVETIPE